MTPALYQSDLRELRHDPAPSILYPSRILMFQKGFLDFLIETIMFSKDI